MGRATQKQITFAKNIAATLNIEMPNNQSFENLLVFINNNSYNFFQVQRNQIISGIKIVDYATEIGFSIVRKGKYFSLKEHDSVIIDSDKNCFWQNSKAGNGHSVGRGGSVIDFAVQFTNQSEAEILRDFRNRVQNLSFSMKQHISVKEKEEQKKELVLPKRADNMKRVYAYLLKTRFLGQDIVQDFVNNKMLYEEKNNHNCVFVSFEEGIPVFASKRGTYTEKRFVGDVENCDYEKGFYINNKSNSLIIAESVIDAMSIMSILKAQGIDYKAYDYMPLSGATKFEALGYQLLKNPKENILLALDNDQGGRENSDIIKKMIDEMQVSVFVSEHFPSAKDWNAELQEAVKKGKYIGEVDFLKIEKTIAPGQKRQSYIENCCKKRTVQMQEKTGTRSRSNEMEI